VENRKRSGDTYKIQEYGVGGWFDIKSTDGLTPYQTEVFDNHKEAQVELNNLMTQEVEYRVVPLETLPDWDPYD
jgi:hypothetical protein